MNEKFTSYRNQLQHYWKNRSKKHKTWIIGSFIGFFAFVTILTVIVTNQHFVPLYSSLSPEETGQIKSTLESKGIDYQIVNSGTGINVPEGQVDSLKVDLAAEGIPKSGEIDYSYFGENNGFGMTDKEFDVVERAAMQTELSNLINSIDGIKSSEVMINLPKENVWVTDSEETASASVVLDLDPGYNLKQEQVRALYHLVSKSVPSLPIDNIVIMDQYFNYFDLNSPDESSSTLTAYQQQREIKEDIEKGLQRDIQRMLGTIMGPDKIVVSVTTDIDFTKETSEKDIVKPVDKENMEGIQVSVERIRETYTGTGGPPGGVAGTGETDIPTYQGQDGGSGDYEHVEERINNEVNRIHKEIVESPYTIRDMGIQVMVEPPNPDDPASLPTDRLDDIEQVLSSVVRTTISQKEENPLTEDEINQKIVVSAQKFNGKPEIAEPKPSIPSWIYIAGGALLVLIVILLFLLMRRGRKREDELEEPVDFERPEIPDLQTQQYSEEATRKVQLERMAKDQPEEFAKLLRSWLSED